MTDSHEKELEGYCAAWDCYEMRSNPYAEGGPYPDQIKARCWHIGWRRGDKEMKEAEG